MSPQNDFRVYRSGRWEAIYESGDRKLTVPVEGSFDGSILYVYLNRNVTWDAPHESVTLSDSDREQIAAAFLESFQARDITVELNPEE